MRRRKQESDPNEPQVITAVWTDDPKTLPGLGRYRRIDGEFLVTDVRRSEHQQAQVGTSLQRYEVFGVRL